MDCSKNRMGIDTRFSLINNTRSIQDQYQGEHCASLGRLAFRELLIKDGWTFDATVAAIFMPLAALGSVLIAPVAQLIYGDWGVASNVSVCFAPLLTGRRELVTSSREFRMTTA
jgi:hypothetical protein